MNLELTGDISSVGASSRNAAELFFDRLNKGGGVALGGRGEKVELVIEDNSANAIQAAAVAQRLISKGGVVAMIGPNSSACAMPAGLIAESLKCVMISPWSTDPKTTVDKISGAPRRYVFRACYTDTFQARVLAGFARKDLGAGTAAVIYDAGSSESAGQAALFRETFTAAGGDVVSYESFVPSDGTCDAVLAPVVASAPDVLFLPVYSGDAAAIALAARRLGIRSLLIGSDAWTSPQILSAGGPDMEGSYFCNHFSPQVATDEARDFIAAYTAAYGQAPDDVAALTYDACGLLTAALEKAGKGNREALREALSQIREYKGVTGTFRFEPGSPDPIKSAVILRIKGGALEWVGNTAPR